MSADAADATSDVEDDAPADVIDDAPSDTDVGLDVLDDAAADGADASDATDTSDALDAFDAADLSDVPVDPVIPAPTGVVASDGTSPTTVTISWEPVDSSDGYRVFRDGVGIADVDGPPWDDEGAARGIPGTVTALDATTDDPFTVTLRWAPPGAVEPGANHVYTVATLRGDRVSEPSAEDGGYTAGGTIVGYEVEFGGEPMPVADATWTDTAALPPTLGVGALTGAWDGARAQLQAPGAGGMPGAARMYRVRARSDADVAGEWSSSVSGRRAIGTLAFVWQRSASDADGGYADLATTSVASWEDSAGPPPGQARYYRVRLTGVGAESVTSAGVRVARPDDPVPDAPTDVQASDGTSEDHVAVTWSAVSGATSYDVYRDDALAASGVTGTSWQDIDAAQGAAPAAPGGVSASTDRTDEVRVSWSAAAQGSAGIAHSYTVAARNDVGEGTRSSANTGYRAAPTVTGYEVSIDSGAWQGAGTSSAGLWDDTGAPAGTVSGGTASASDGTSSTHVSLSLSGASASPGNVRSYRVRAVASDGRDGTASGSVSGRRAVGTLTYQWQRTSSDSVSGTWSNLSGATSASHNDTTAPSDGSGRYYRCEVSAAGAVSSLSTEDRGSRTIPLPDEPTDVQASDGTSEERVAVTWSAVSGATSYDVYRDGSLAVTGVTGTSWQDADAAQGAVPAAPGGVSASTDRTDEVRVSWSAAAQGSAGSAHSYTVAARNDVGAGMRSAANTGYRAAPTVTGYEVSIDGGPWQGAGTSSAGMWDDTGAPAGTVIGGTASASDGTSSTHVSLSLSGARASPGAPRSYRVRAVASDGRDGTESGAVSGQRAVGTLTYQWQRTEVDDEDGVWGDLMGADAGVFDDAGAPDDGSGRYYRCEVSGAGAVSALSTADRGFRSVLLSPLGATCSSGTTCESGFCGNGRCAPEGFSYIAPGTFTMGSPTTELGRGTDETQHGVTLTRAYFMQQTEVTQGQWRARMGNNPSGFTACGDSCPVDRVNWYEALAYANALSDAEGLARCYALSGCSNTPGNDMECTDVSVTAAGGNPLLCEGYRLPTESEWEYAARAGTATATYLGNLQTPYNCDPQPSLEPIAWYCENAGGTTHQAATRTANAWGVYDMLGNVWEWCWDWYGTYPGTATDPLGAAPGSNRVLRGGSWSSNAQFARAAVRNSNSPGIRNPYRGFRLARSN